LIVVAAACGTLLSSAILFHEIDRFSLLPLPFALLGTAVIATFFGVLIEMGWVRWFAYVLVIALGAVLGSASLAIPTGMDAANGLLGVAYGSVCAICWVVLDIFTPSQRPIRRP